VDREIPQVRLVVVVVVELIYGTMLIQTPHLWLLAVVVVVDTQMLPLQALMDKQPIQVPQPLKRLLLLLMGAVAPVEQVEEQAVEVQQVVLMVVAAAQDGVKMEPRKQPEIIILVMDITLSQLLLPD
jgi:hypothetical protein